MECKNIQERLSAYLDGEVSSEEKRLIDAHLPVCDKCAISLAELRKTLAYVRSLEEVEPPPWMTQKVMEKIRSGERKPRRFLESLFYPLHIKLPIEAAAVVLVAIFAVYLVREMPPETRSVKAPSEEIAPQAPLKDSESKKPGSVTERIPEQSAKLQEVAAPREETSPASARKEGSGYASRQEDGSAISPSPEEARKKISPLPLPFVKGGKEVLDKAQQAPAPAAKQEVPVPPEGLAVGNEEKPGRFSRAPQAKALSERKREIISITVKVDDMKAAEKAIGQVIESLGGRIMKRESGEDGSVFITELPSRKLGELVSALRRIGEVEEGAVSGDSEGVIQVRIKVVEIVRR